MAVINLTNLNFEDEVMRSDKPVLIDFFATWCGPCRMVSPLVDEIAQERSDIKVCKVDVDDQGELASEFGVSSIPMLVVLKNGQISAKSVGAMPKEDILALLDK
ncbi:thioredoxin [Ruminococcus sp. FC2018]|uniref:thioredoxin n=1 Tax=Ruminococcus sp. FC2018 TaxID=1410617 RepID=UPI00048D346F|nr:thioredoxin [Ruminococcus sp. FC2018]